MSARGNENRGEGGLAASSSTGDKLVGESNLKENTSFSSSCSSNNNNNANCSVSSSTALLVVDPIPAGGTTTEAESAASQSSKPKRAVKPVDIKQQFMHEFQSNDKMRQSSSSNGKRKQYRNLNRAIEISHTRETTIIDGFYEVEKIEKIKSVGKYDLRFFIKWKGWEVSDNTWEPFQNIRSCIGCLQEFYERTLAMKRIIHTDSWQLFIGCLRRENLISSTGNFQSGSRRKQDRNRKRNGNKNSTTTSGNNNNPFLAVKLEEQEEKHSSSGDESNVSREDEDDDDDQSSKNSSNFSTNQQQSIEQEDVAEQIQKEENNNGKHVVVASNKDMEIEEVEGRKEEKETKEKTENSRRKLQKVSKSKQIRKPAAATATATSRKNNNCSIIRRAVKAAKNEEQQIHENKQKKEQGVIDAIEQTESKDLFRAKIDDNHTTISIKKVSAGATTTTTTTNAAPAPTTTMTTSAVIAQISSNLVCSPSATTTTTTTSTASSTPASHAPRKQLSIIQSFQNSAMKQKSVVAAAGKTESIPISSSSSSNLLNPQSVQQSLPLQSYEVSNQSQQQPEENFSASKNMTNITRKVSEILPSTRMEEEKETTIIQTNSSKQSEKILENQVNQKNEGVGASNELEQQSHFIEIMSSAAVAAAAAAAAAAAGSATAARELPVEKQSKRFGVLSKLISMMSEGDYHNSDVQDTEMAEEHHGTNQDRINPLGVYENTAQYEETIDANKVKPYNYNDVQGQVGGNSKNPKEMTAAIAANGTTVSLISNSKEGKYSRKNNSGADSSSKIGALTSGSVIPSGSIVAAATAATVVAAAAASTNSAPAAATTGQSENLKAYERSLKSEYEQVKHLSNPAVADPEKSVSALYTGNYWLKDEPSRILAVDIHPFLKGQYIFQVSWTPRRKRDQVLCSWVEGEKLRRKCPLLLIEFYESFIRFID